MNVRPVRAANAGFAPLNLDRSALFRGRGLCPGTFPHDIDLCVMGRAVACRRSQRARWCSANERLRLVFKSAAGAPMYPGMNAHDPSFDPDPDPGPDFAFSLRADARNGRQHRFMESSDVNAAFRLLFRPLRQNIRRGMGNLGQVYALEMDPCVPGALLASEWIPPAARGVTDVAELADPGRRAALFARLLAETRPHALFAYVAEREGGRRGATLFVELVSADGRWAADYPIRAGRGWHRRELQRAPHRRV